MNETIEKANSCSILFQLERCASLLCSLAEEIAKLDSMLQPVQYQGPTPMRDDCSKVEAVDNSNASILQSLIVNNDRISALISYINDIKSKLQI